MATWNGELSASPSKPSGSYGCLGGPSLRRMRTQRRLHYELSPGQRQNSSRRKLTKRRTHMNNRLFVCTAAFLPGSAISTNAQDQLPQPQNHPPVVNPDRSVTFAIELPNAKEVRMFGDIILGPRLPFFQRGANNLWTYTSEPVEPGT